MVDDEYIEFANISEFEFTWGGFSFALPFPFKPELYGACPNIAEISTDTNDQSKLAANLGMITALRDAFIHDKPCIMQLRFAYAQIPPGPPLPPILPQPHPNSMLNMWNIIGVKFRRQ